MPHQLFHTLPYYHTLSANTIKIIRTNILLMSFFMSSFAQKHRDTLACEQLQHVQDLKNGIAQKAWKDFDNNQAAQVYFTDSSSYFFNADTRILQKVTKKTSPLKGIDLFKTQRIDENPFHM